MDSYPSRAYGIPQCVRRHRQQCFAVRLRVLRQQDQHLVGPLRLKRQQVRGVDRASKLNERVKGRLNHRKLRRIAAQSAAGQFTQRRELRNEAGGLVLKMVFSGQVCTPGLLAVSGACSNCVALAEAWRSVAANGSKCCAKAAATGRAIRIRRVIWLTSLSLRLALLAEAGPGGPAQTWRSAPLSEGLSSSTTSAVRGHAPPPKRSTRHTGIRKERSGPHGPLRGRVRRKGSQGSGLLGTVKK